MADLGDAHVNAGDGDHQVAGHFPERGGLVEEVEDDGTSQVGAQPQQEVHGRVQNTQQHIRLHWLL